MSYLTISFIALYLGYGFILGYLFTRNRWKVYGFAENLAWFLSWTLLWLPFFILFLFHKS